MWWHVLVISAPERQRQVNSWSSPSLAYLVNSRQTGDLASKASRGMAPEERHQDVSSVFCAHTQTNRRAPWHKAPCAHMSVVRGQDLVGLNVLWKVVLGIDLWGILLFQWERL